MKKVILSALFLCAFVTTTNAISKTETKTVKKDISCHEHACIVMGAVEDIDPGADSTYYEYVYTVVFESCQNG